VSIYNSGDARSTGYIPADGADWPDPDPSNVADALDALAAAGGGGNETWSAVSVHFAGAGDVTDPQITGNSTDTFAMDTEDLDALGEYDTGTGVFTATAAGTYSVTLCINHSGNTRLHPAIQYEPAAGGGYTTYRHGTLADTTSSLDDTGIATCVIQLAAGDKLRAAATNISATAARIRGTAFNTAPETLYLTYLEIARVR